MLEDDKYYTPEIEEFCVGFEYEIKLNNNSWEKHIFKPHSDNFSHRFKEETWFTEEGGSRVKYLDGDDVMSFGFEIANDEGNTYKSLKKLRGLGTGDDRTLFVQHEVFRTPSGDIRINTWLWWRENRGTEITVFEGSIRNKYEFRQLLKQIHAGSITTKQ